MSVYLHTDGEYILTFQTGVHEKHAARLTLVFFLSLLSSFSACFLSLAFRHAVLLFHM